LFKNANQRNKKGTARVDVNELATILRAQPAGHNRWIAKCPAHHDRTPSLSIREGQAGRILLHCFSGFRTIAVLEALGLRRADLYCGPPPAPAQIRQMAMEREQRGAEVQSIRVQRCKLDSLYLRLSRVADALGAKLARSADGAPGTDALAKLFHECVERLHRVEGQLAEVEKWR
jgi:hypothetical protein